MPARVFKYPLQLEQREMLMMPVGAKILTVTMQNDMPVLYALVDESYPPCPRIIRTVTTGDEFDPTMSEYIGTIQAGSPSWFVAHVFEQFEGFGETPSTRWAEDFKQIREELSDAG